MMIFGIPDEEPYEYEFMVVMPRADGNCNFHSNHETAEAYDVAKEIGGNVVHDVRITRKRLKTEVATFITEELEVYSDDIFSCLLAHNKYLNLMARVYKQNFCKMVDTLVEEVKNFEKEKNM